MVVLLLWKKALLLLGLLDQFRADLFSRHASPSEVCTFVAVDERGEDVISHEICRRCNGK